MTEQMRIKQAKEAFQTGLPVDESVLRHEILDSWKRSKAHGVRTDVVDKRVISAEELKKRIRAHQTFYDIANAFMESLYEFTTGSGYLTAIADEEGYVLRVFGDEEIAEMARANELVEGCNRSEDKLGTNGIGTPLALGVPLQVFGEEHYYTLHHNWVCSGAPIFNADGSTAGVVCLIGSSDKVSFHTLGMAAAAAEAISRQLIMKQAYREVELSQQRMSAILEANPSGMLLFDQNMRVAHYNNKAAHLLQVEAASLQGRSFWELFGSDSISERELAQGVNDRYVTIEREGRQINLSITARPTDLGERVIILVKAETLHKMVNRIIGSDARFTFEDIMGASPALVNAVSLARIAATNNSNVLLIGESGTGKELFAQAIHNASDRRDGPFVAINCGALPKSLIESELFGYEGGTFTGARREGCAGKFELANGGTIFLDEIGDMPFDVQVALLRVLQNQEVSRLGSSKTIKIDVRVIAATNKDLIAAIDNNEFRNDLYYRLNVFNIRIPPLRERRGDVRLLSDYFLNKYADFSGHRLTGFTDEAYAALERYEWRGNIRELENAVERAVYITNRGAVGAECFPLQMAAMAPPVQEETAAPARQTLPVQSFSIKENEQRQIEEALVASGGNVKRAAELLGISRRTLYRKLEKYEIDSNSIRHCTV